MDGMHDFSRPFFFDEAKGVSSREHRERKKNGCSVRTGVYWRFVLHGRRSRKGGFADISYTTHGVLGMLPLTNREVSASVYTYHNQRYSYYCYSYYIMYLALSYITQLWPLTKGGPLR